MLEEYPFVYLAGFFDGEGCVDLRKRKSKGKYTQYLLRTSISQKSSWLLGDIKLEFGGYLGRKKNGIWELQLTAGGAERFLRRIYPYVQIKERVVRLGLRARELQSKYRVGIGHPTPEHVKQELDKIRQEISKLNKET